MPFSSLDEMHQVLIDNWNRVVADGDLVLHLGDVAFSGQAYDSIMPQLNVNKYLIRGNHDRFSEGRYRRYFTRIVGCYIRDRYVFTHVPNKQDCMARWIGNIHWHLHASIINDPRYFKAAVEQIIYTPIDFEVIKRVLGEGQKAKVDENI